MKTLMMVASMIVCTVAANLLIKTGAVMGRAMGGTLVEQMLNWRVVSGLACFGVAGLIWAVMLRTLPLNVAQSFTAAQFIANILAAAVILSEPITGMRWLGMALIASGILVVGWTANG